MLSRSLCPPFAIDVPLTLRPLCRGRGDPCGRIDSTGVWRATRTPEGPCTFHVRNDGAQLATEAWGPGAAWIIDRMPSLVGFDDDDQGFRPAHPVVAELHRRMPGLRIPRSRAVLEVLVPSILEQKVVGKEARRSWASLARAHGERAPGPARLLLPPAPERLAGLPYYAFHPFGVERRRADTVRRVCARARRVEEAAGLDRASAHRRLTAFPGVGVWTAAEVALVALGDADAVSVGDYHLPHVVSWALTGERRGDDDRMLELLEPFRGHRGRVQRLLEASGLHPPPRGPRQPLRSIARF